MEIGLCESVFRTPSNRTGVITMALNTGRRKVAALVGVLVVLGLLAYTAFNIYLVVKGDPETQSSPSVEQAEKADEATEVRTQDEPPSAESTETEDEAEVTVKVETAVQDEVEAEAQAETTPSVEVEESEQESTHSPDIVDVDAQTIRQAQDQLDGLSLYIKSLLVDLVECHVALRDLEFAADNLFTSETAYQDLGIIVTGDLSAQMWLDDETLDISDEERLSQAKILIGHAVNDIQRAEYACGQQNVSQEVEQPASTVSQSSSGDDSSDTALDDPVDLEADGSTDDDSTVMIDEGIAAQLAEIVQSRFNLEVALYLLIHSGCFVGNEEATDVINTVVPIISDQDIGTFEAPGPVGEIEGLIVKSGEAMVDGDLTAAQEFADAATALLDSTRQQIESVSSLPSCMGTP